MVMQEITSGSQGFGTVSESRAGNYANIVRLIVWMRVIRAKLRLFLGCERDAKFGNSS